MQQGRKATDAKQYDAAIKAFDAALAARPGDPYALAERGYARLLQGTDLTAASRDLDAAAARTNDAKQTKLSSMIWFNRGLVEEKRGNKDNAVAAFTKANTLRPTAAAKAKLAGVAGATCPIVEKGYTSDLDVKGVTTDDKTVVELAAEHDVDRDVWIAKWNPVAGKLRVEPIDEHYMARCTDSVEYTVVKKVGNRALLHGTRSASVYTDMCNTEPEAADDPHPCDERKGETGGGTACFDGETSTRDVVLDLEKGGVILVVSDADPVTLSLEADGLHMKGLGCDRVEPLAH